MVKKVVQIGTRESVKSAKDLTHAHKAASEDIPDRGRRGGSLKPQTEKEVTMSEERSMKFSPRRATLRLPNTSHIVNLKTRTEPNQSEPATRGIIQWKDLQKPSNSSSPMKWTSDAAIEKPCDEVSGTEKVLETSTT